MTLLYPYLLTTSGDVLETLCYFYTSGCYVWASCEMQAMSTLANSSLASSAGPPSAAVVSVESGGKTIVEVCTQRRCDGEGDRHLLFQPTHVQMRQSLTLQLQNRGGVKSDLRSFSEAYVWLCSASTSKQIPVRCWTDGCGQLQVQKVWSSQL